MALHDTNHAIYLPAVNQGYATSVALPLPQGRRFPSGLTPKDLMFWEPNGLWHYPYLLHSIGQYSVGKAPHAAMDKASRTDSILVGDSGGYQIGSGTLNGLNYVKQKKMKAADAVNAWRDETVARDWIMNWLSAECDYAMTIDMPLWAKDKKGENSPFHLCSTEQLIAMTDQNLRLIDAMCPPHVKWLNVIQGSSSFEDAFEWWEAVKWFRKGGWALAGSAGVAGGLFNMLVIVLMMRDENAFDAGQDWLHVLGVSTPFWAAALTAIQEGLRQTNSQVSVSFDSSSPFQTGGRYEEVALTPAFGIAKSTWTIKTQPAPQHPLSANANCTDAFPHQQSPLGRILMVNELCVQEGMWQARQYDSLSNALLINHNIWVYLNAFKQANDLVAQRDVRRIPAEYLQCFDLIKHLFAIKGDWFSELEQQKGLLDKLAPLSL
jgi:hypothetical protein